MYITSGITQIALLFAVKLNEIISKFLVSEEVWDMKNDKAAPVGFLKIRFWDKDLVVAGTLFGSCSQKVQAIKWDKTDERQMYITMLWIF